MITFPQLKKLVKDFKPEPTGDDFLDARYDEQVEVQRRLIPYYRFFYQLAQAAKPKSIVELGSFQGTAAAHFAAGAPSAKVVTIDIHKDDARAKVRTMEAATQYRNLDYINAWTYEAVKDLPLSGIDILFIDSWHRKDHFLRDWADYSPLVRQPGLIIVDDVFDHDDFPDMVEVFNDLPGQKFIDKTLHPDNAMGFVYVAKPDQKPNTTTNRATSKRTTGTTKGRRTAKSVGAVPEIVSSTGDNKKA